MFELTIQNGILQILLQSKALDLAVGQQLRERIKALWAQNPSVRSVSIDLGTVGFIDSSGLGSILSIYRLLPREQGLIEIVNATPSIRRIFEVHRLDHIFSWKAHGA